MPKKFQKYFSKFRKPPSNPSMPFSSSSTCRILPRCGKPRTPSFSLDSSRDVDVDRGEVNAVDRFLFENFNALYDQSICSSDRGEQHLGFPFDSPNQALDSGHKIKVLSHPQRETFFSVDNFGSGNLKSMYDLAGEKGGKQSVEVFYHNPIDLKPEIMVLDHRKGISVSDSNDFSSNSLKSSHYTCVEEKGEKQGKERLPKSPLQSMNFPIDVPMISHSASKIERFTSKNPDYDSRISFDHSRSNESAPEINISHSEFDRFFVVSGRSGSLLEEASTSEAVSNVTGTVETTEYSGEMALPDDSVAVRTKSVDPYDDFRRSMREMVEARAKQGAETDWNFMEELLFCYLNLNEKASHQYILRAFVDVIGPELRPARKRQMF